MIVLGIFWMKMIVEMLQVTLINIIMEAQITVIILKVAFIGMRTVKFVITEKPIVGRVAIANQSVSVREKA